MFVEILWGPFIEKQAITGLTTTEDTINKNPTLVSDVVYAMQEAMILIHKEKDVSYRTAKKLFPKLSEKVVKNAVDRMMRDAMYPESIVVDDILSQRTLKTRLDSGELQRFALIQRLILSPKLLVLDEPFGAMDIILRRDLSSLIREIVKARGIYALVVTHQPEDALFLAENILILSRVAKGSASEISRRMKKGVDFDDDS